MTELLIMVVMRYSFLSTINNLSIFACILLVGRGIAIVE